MDEKVKREKQILDNLIRRYPTLASVQTQIMEAYLVLKACYQAGGKVLLAGNGGSGADGEHIVGELMKGFVLPRRIPSAQQEKLMAVDETLGKELALHLQGALPAVALHVHTSLMTAFSNDVAPDICFAQQVYGYGSPKDVLWGISTSGNSKNVIYAAVTEKAMGMKVIGLTGERKNRLMEYADVCIAVPETETYKIQELHLPVYHCLSMMLEQYFFG